MGIMAVFGCGKCGGKTVRGYFSGHSKSGDDKAPNEYVCYPCKAKTRHNFVGYEQIDERSDAQRMRDRINEQAK